MDNGGGSNGSGRMVEYSMGPMLIETVNPRLNLQSNLNDLHLEPWKLNLLVVSQVNDHLYLASGKLLMIIKAPAFGRALPLNFSAGNLFRKISQIEFPALITGLRRFQVDFGEIIVGTCENGSFGIVIDTPPSAPPTFFFTQVSPESLWGIDFFKEEWVVASSNTHDAYIFPFNRYGRSANLGRQPTQYPIRFFFP